MIALFIETLQRETKQLEFIQSSLRSASDLYKRGGHVTMVYSDRMFSLVYDNKRIIVDNTDKADKPLYAKIAERQQILSQQPNEEEVSSEKALLLKDSLPIPDILRGQNQRYLSQIHKVKGFTRFSTGTSKTKYKS